MFELLSFLQLQQLWWMIVSLLAGLFVFLMFIQGGQTLLFSLPENEVEKSMLINSLGRKWELGCTRAFHLATLRIGTWPADA